MLVKGAQVFDNRESIMAFYPTHKRIIFLNVAVSGLTTINTTSEDVNLEARYYCGPFGSNIIMYITDSDEYTVHKKV